VPTAEMAENVRHTRKHGVASSLSRFSHFFFLLGNSCLHKGTASGEAVVIYVWVVQGVERCHCSS